MDGGGDPVAMLKKFPHRTATIHLTEHGGPQGAVIGEGDVPWKADLRALRNHLRYPVVRRGAGARTSRACRRWSQRRLCLENLRKMGK